MTPSQIQILTGSFVLYPKNTTSNLDVTVYLSVSGPGSSDYSSSDTVNVRVLSDRAPPPPPVLLAAKFDNVLFTFTISFSAATNKVVYSPVVSKLFPFFTYF